MLYSTIIGIDTHNKKNCVCAINFMTGELTKATLGGDPSKLVKWVLEQGFEEPVRAVYESGPTGFTLAKALMKADIRCDVAAVSRLPKDRSRKKNDKRDAETLCRLALAGSIKEVYIPDARGESLRDLSRLRHEAARDLAAAKQRVSSFMVLRGIVYDKTKKRWTKTFRKWAQALTLTSEIDTFVFQEKYREVLRLEYRLLRIENAILDATASDERLKENTERFMCIYGIGQVTAFALVAEIHDFDRFKNGSALAAYLGLVPSENSSGDKVSTGKITKCGNPHIRRLLIECASSYTKRMRMNAYCKAHSTPEVMDLAEKCKDRLMRRADALKKRGKAANKIKVAIARELAEWIYHIAVI